MVIQIAIAAVVQEKRSTSNLYELIHFANMLQIIVSDVGRTISGSCTRREIEEERQSKREVR